MNEKTMVADTLAGINGELVRYGEMIPQTENPELKQTLKQIRNQCEMSQEEIYRIARTKGYYCLLYTSYQSDSRRGRFCVCKRKYSGNLYGNRGRFDH